MENVKNYQFKYFFLWQKKPFNHDLFNLEHLMSKISDYRELDTYDRMMVGGKKISSTIYDKNKKYTYSSFFQKKRDIFLTIKSFVCFSKDTGNFCILICEIREIFFESLGIYKLSPNCTIKYLTIDDLFLNFSQCCFSDNFIFEIPSIEMF